MVSKISKSSDKHNVELFKFFENTKAHKTSPKSKKSPKLMSFKLPQRRTTRLKSEIFVENYPQVLPDGEYDISKEDFDTSLEPLQRGSKSTSDLNNSISNGDTLNTTLENNMDDRDVQKSEKSKKRSKRSKKLEVLETVETQKTPLDKNDSNLENDEEYNELLKPKRSERRSRNLKTNDTDMIESIDVNAIAEMLKDTNFKKQNCEEEGSKKGKKRKRSENSEQSDNVLQRDNDKFAKISEVAKKSKINSDVEDHEQKLNKKSKNKIKSKERDSLRNNSDSCLYDDNPQLSLTVSDDDENLISFSKETNIEKDKYSKKSKKKTNLENNLYENYDDLEKTANSPVYELNSSLETNDLNSNHVNNTNLENDDNNSNLTLNVNNENNLEKSSVESKKTETKSKNRNNSLSNKNTSSSSLNIENKENNLGKDASQPKKRGRKPKNLNDSLISDQNTSSNAKGILKYFTVKNKKLEKSDKQNDNLDNTQVSAIENSPTLAKPRNTRSRRSNNLNTTNTSAKSNHNKSGNSEEQRKHRVVKVNIPRELRNPKKTKMCKLTKEQIKKGTNRKIPKNKLDEILEMVDDEDHSLWEDRNISCNPCIHNYWESRHIKSEHNMKIKYARQFLLRRDWVNLSKILSLHNSDLTYYYPLLAKYATILMAHTDTEQFDKLIQFLTCVTDSKTVIKKCTKISKNNEE